MARLADRTYGQALFELSVEENKVDTYAAQISDVRALFAGNPDLMKLLTHPQIQSEQKIEVIQNCFEGQVDDQIEAFMEIIIKAGRQAEMMKIFDYFLKQVKAYKHIGTAYVTSAKELTERQKLAIEARLLELTDFISFEMVYQTDPSLIGGMVIRIGDKVVDSSIKTKLENMSKELLSIQL